MRKWVLLLVLILLMGVMPAAAQDDASESSLLDLLAAVPDTPATRQYLTYANYRAMYATYPGAPDIRSYEDVMTSMDTDLPATRLLLGLSSGPQLFTYALSAGEDIVPTMGFDVFGLDQGLEYGSPPSSVTLITGDFDNATVIAAHEARGYSASEKNGRTLLCGESGCDTGMMTNLQNRNTANLFGGQFGRSQPVLLGDNLIASSPDITALEKVNNTLSGSGSSLADQPDYRAATEAISENGILTQAYFITPQDIGSLTDVISAINLDQAQIDAIRDRLEDTVSPLPPYSLVAIADTVVDDEEHALVALVYDSPEAAQAAAALFPAQLDGYISVRTNSPVSELLEDRSVTSVEASVFSASTDHSVMVLTLTAPLLPELPDNSSFQATGRVYRLLVDMYLARDFGWLATAL